jgi:DNA-directed RNA polymerase specialized sigma24 family protein
MFLIGFTNREMQAMYKNRYLNRYEIMADEDLCSAAQGGDKKASDILIKRSEKWVRQCAKEWRIPGLDDDDIYSIALMETCRAIHTYKTGAEAKFKTYIAAVIRQTCSNEKRISAKGRFAMTGPTISYDPRDLPDLEIKISGFSPARSAEDLALGKIENQRLISEINTKMTERKNANGSVYEALRLLAAGAGIESVSGALGLPIYAVRRMRHDAEKHLKNILTAIL